MENQPRRSLSPQYHHRRTLRNAAYHRRHPAISALRKHRLIRDYPSDPILPFSDFDSHQQIQLRADNHQSSAQVLYARQDSLPDAAHDLHRLRWIFELWHDTILRKARVCDDTIDLDSADIRAHKQSADQEGDSEQKLNGCLARRGHRATELILLIESTSGIKSDYGLARALIYRF